MIWGNQNRFQSCKLCYPNKIQFDRIDRETHRIKAREGTLAALISSSSSWNRLLSLPNLLMFCWSSHVTCVSDPSPFDQIHPSPIKIQIQRLVLDPEIKRSCIEIFSARVLGANLLHFAFQIDCLLGLWLVLSFVFGLIGGRFDRVYLPLCKCCKHAWLRSKVNAVIMKREMLNWQPELENSILVDSKWAHHLT